jgi:hypothetical protein
MGKTQPSPKASSFAKASAVAEAMADRTEDVTAGQVAHATCATGIRKMRPRFPGVGLF